MDGKPTLVGTEEPGRPALGQPARHVVRIRWVSGLWNGVSETASHLRFQPSASIELFSIQATALFRRDPIVGAPDVEVLVVASEDDVDRWLTSRARQRVDD